jgi:hypothetical protein
MRHVQLAVAHTCGEEARETGFDMPAVDAAASIMHTVFLFEGP